MIATSLQAARVLDIGDEATLEDVQRARRALALKYHPDRSDDPERATRHMARINVAADTLIGHLKKHATPEPKPKTEPFSTGSKTSPRKSGLPISVPRTTRHTARLHVQERAPHSVKSRNRASAPSEADLALGRLASASYRDVLDRIARAKAGSTVDIRTLNFATPRASASPA